MQKKNSKIIDVKVSVKKSIIKIMQINNEKKRKNKKT